jgi:hypothetical protein
MDIEITEKIEKMRAEGKLDTEQSVDLILQLLVNLQEGQQDIIKVLTAREDDIRALSAQMGRFEDDLDKVEKILPQVAVMETRLCGLEATIGILAESLKMNAKTLEKVEEESKLTMDMAHDLKRHVMVYWIMNHKLLSIFFLGVFITLVNFHAEVYSIIMSLLGFRITLP